MPRVQATRRIVVALLCQGASFDQTSNLHLAAKHSTANDSLGVQKGFPRRPPRLTWLSAKVLPFYFVTFNTWERIPLLANREVHEAFREFCLKAQEHHIAVGQYVLMPDHVHMFVMLPAEGPTLTRWIRALRTVLGKRILALGNNKPHWQDGFFDHLLRTSESYSSKWEYVQQNPVRAGLCQEPEEWPFQGEIGPIEFR